MKMETWIIHIPHGTYVARTVKTWQHLQKVLSQLQVQDYNSLTGQQKDCSSSAFDDYPGRGLFRVLKRSPISQPYVRDLCSDGKAVGNITRLRRRLHPHRRVSCYSHYAERSARLKLVPIFKQRPTRDEASALTIGPNIRLKFQDHRTFLLSERCTTVT